MLNLEKHMNLIRKVVWSYVRKNPGLEFEDMVSDAYIACLEAQGKYHPSRGAETTFIWTVVSNRMRDILYKEARNKIVTVVYENVGDDLFTGAIPGLEHDYIAQEEWAEKFAQLSPEAQYICQLAIKPARYLSTDSPAKYKNTLMTVLRNRGWKKVQVNRGFQEIKEVLSP